MGENRHILDEFNLLNAKKRLIYAFAFVFGTQFAKHQMTTSQYDIKTFFFLRIILPFLTYLLLQRSFL
jgi:hypothetical protein